MEVYPLVNVYNLLLKIAIDIVDLPSYKMVIFHSYVSLPEGKHCETHRVVMGFNGMYNQLHGTNAICGLPPESGV